MGGARSDIRSVTRPLIVSRCFDRKSFVFTVSLSIDVLITTLDKIELLFLVHRLNASTLTNYHRRGQLFAEEGAAADVNMAMAGEQSTNLHEMIEDGESDSATEEDPAALGSSNSPFTLPKDPSQHVAIANLYIHHVAAPEPSFAHLREISPLASWTVSTYKPGCGVEALRSPSTSQFWQSDGPQPHLLNIHFFKLVSIVRLRVHLDFELDESYTPTRMVFLAGTGMYDLTEFAEWMGEAPTGWVEIGLDGVGCGGGNVLRAMVVQVRVCENHQNGKDTHVRGVQIYARDEREGKGPRLSGGLVEEAGQQMEGELFGLDHRPDWMGSPELR